MAKGNFRNINLRQRNSPAQAGQRGKKSVMQAETIPSKRWQMELRKAGASRKPFKSH